MISLLVAKKEFIRSLKNKKKLILTFLLPLVSIIVAIGLNNLMKPSINLGILENEYINKSVVEQIENVNRVNISIANKSSVNTDMILAKYAGVIEFGKDNKFEIHCLDNSMKKSLEESLAQVINSGKVSKIENLLSILSQDSLSAPERASGFIFVTLIITCTMSSVIMLKDKEDKVVLRYFITPNKISSYIFGNYIYNLISTIIQIVVATIVLIIFKVNLGIDLNDFIIIGIIIAIVSTSMATLFTIISKSELQASILASSIALIMSLLGGAFLPIAKMPHLLQVLSSLSITKWIIKLTNLMENDIMYGNTLSIIGFIIILSLAILILSTTIGKKKLKY